MLFQDPSPPTVSVHPVRESGIVNAITRRATRAEARKSIARRSAGGAAIDGLKESRGFENVNRLRNFRLYKLPFARGHGCRVLAWLVV